VGNVKLKDSLGCSDCEMVAFKILTAVRMVHSKLTTLDLGREDFGLFWDMLINIQGSPPPSSGAMLPNKEEVR